MGLTQEQIEAQIVEERHYKLGNKTTAVVLILKNGFEVVGTAACVRPEDFDMAIGVPFARQRALDKVWELEGYVAQDKAYEIDIAGM